MPHDFACSDVFHLGPHEPTAAILQGVLGESGAFFDGAGVADKPSASFAGVPVVGQFDREAANTMASARASPIEWMVAVSSRTAQKTSSG